MLMENFHVRLYEPPDSRQWGKHAEFGEKARVDRSCASMGLAGMRGATSGP